MKNVVECYKEFFGYSNALETHGEMSITKPEVPLTRKPQNWIDSDSALLKGRKTLVLKRRRSASINGKSL